MGRELEGVGLWLYGRQRAFDDESTRFDNAHFEVTDTSEPPASEVIANAAATYRKEVRLIPTLRAVELQLLNGDDMKLSLLIATIGGNSHTEQRYPDPTGWINV